MEKVTTIQAIDTIRSDIERMGGSIGAITSNARWVQLEGVFTPEQLRRIAKEIEKKWKDRS